MKLARRACWAHPSGVNIATDQPTDKDFAGDLVRPMFYANASRRMHWAKKVLTFKAVQGWGRMLDHVDEARWLDHYAANEDPFDAVVSELEAIDG